MSWYYSENNERRGPLEDAAFQALVSAGSIRPDTLVWREGMAEWSPYASVAGGGAAPVAVGAPAGAAPLAAARAGSQACSQCGRFFPADEMISYEGSSICAECKPLFFQRVKEGAVVVGAREYAGFWIRFAAKFVDGILLNIMGKVVGLVVGLALGDGAAVIWISFGLGLGINAAYVIYFTGKSGATPGKMACKIEVIRADGSPMTYGRATGRFFAEFLSALTLLIGYIMAGFDEEKRALHDRICDTRVVRKR